MNMKRTMLWLAALIITLSTAVYQRLTGPTYPLRGKANLDSSVISYKLARSHGGATNHQISIKVENQEITGYAVYKRYKTSDPWTTLPMTRKDKFLIAELPHQPPAGKLEYTVVLALGEKKVSLTGEKSAVIRFKGDVPSPILIPHVILMFLAMLFSNRAGIEALLPKGKSWKYAIWVVCLLFAGGAVFGPLVQKFAFGSFWTGFPLGHDLTDNKTLIVLLGWIVAVLATRKDKKHARWWILGAAILLLAVYLIPHSLMGSELVYSQQ